MGTKCHKSRNSSTWPKSHDPPIGQDRKITTLRQDYDMIEELTFRKDIIKGSQLFVMIRHGQRVIILWNDMIEESQSLVLENIKRLIHKTYEKHLVWI